MATISGTVKDSSGLGAARLVRAYRQDTGILQATTTSNASGEFSLTVASTLPHRVVCEDSVQDATCKLLMHFDGANNGTVFTEETGKTVTMSAAVTSTAMSTFGGSSGYFNGAAYVSVPSSADLLFGAEDFCIEFDCAVVSLPGTGYFGLLSKYVSATGGRSYSVDLYGDGSTTRFTLLLSTSGNSAEVVMHSLSGISVGKMYHIEVSRAGSTVYFFIDGALQGTADIGTASLYANSQPLVVGGRSNYTAFVNVLVDELRIRKAAGNTSAYVGGLPTKPYSLLTVYGENALVFDSVVPV